MSLDAHIEQLQSKHQKLEGELSSLVLSPSASDTEIADLKRRKLQIKDQILKLSNTRN
ncbi:MAG: DUF465 domain-containing protein [Pseudomonadota bacterium]